VAFVGTPLVAWALAAPGVFTDDFSSGHRAGLIIAWLVSLVFAGLAWDVIRRSHHVRG